MKIITITLQGTTPLLMHRFNEQAEASSARGTRKIKMAETPPTPREVAESCAYRTDKGDLYTPSTWVMGALISAGAERKIIGSRKSMRFLLPSAVRSHSDRTRLLDPETRQPIRDFEVDARPVVIPATKGRVMRYRPRIEQWLLECDMALNDDMISQTAMIEILNDAGQRYGIGDFRPEKRGPFGCFVVVGATDHE
jgi:hypothetical protein